MWFPAVKALAPTARADSAARLSVCKRTRLKSNPKLGSIADRVALSSGWPGDSTTSRTSEGAGFPAATPAASRCTQMCEPSVCWRAKNPVAE
jgi:hypothetical protein